MTLFVICHSTLPDYRPPEGSVILWMSPLSPPPTDIEVVRGYDYFETPERLHEALSGALGAMAIQRHLKATGLPADDRVTIWQYRKFVTDVPLGRPSPNFRVMRLVNRGEAEGLSLTMPGATAPFMITTPAKTDSVGLQYQRSHNMLDLLRYTALAIELGVLPHKNTLSWYNETVLIPGGIELGTFPAGWWQGAMETMARVSLAFVEQHGPAEPDDPYQKRAVAFCQERMGSQILLQHLRANADTPGGRYITGIMHTVTDDAVYVGGNT